MRIAVLLNVVPDIVEDLEVAPGGTSLDTEFLRMVPSEFDEHSIEQALLLKERYGGTVSVVALDAPEVDDALFRALACGADSCLKITGAPSGIGTTQAAAIYADALANNPDLKDADLILTGVQAIDDLDGLLGPLVAFRLGLPFIGIVTAVTLKDSGRQATVVREYPGAVRGEFEVKLPAVLGVQAAEHPPRYVPVAKIRAAMKTRQLDSFDAQRVSTPNAPLSFVCMRKPECTAHAEMIEGSLEEISARLSGILTDRARV